MNYSITEQEVNPDHTGNSPVDDVYRGQCADREPLLCTVITPLPTSDDSSFDSTLSGSTPSSSAGVICNQLVNPGSLIVPIVSRDDTSMLLYQPYLRLYTNGQEYKPHAPKDYSPHDSVESYHNWAKREKWVLTMINQRVGKVSMILRFHCDLTKWEYAALFSQLRKELQKIGVEWLMIGDVTTDGFDHPINRLHWHFAFDTPLSPETMGAQFQAACGQAFYRMVRRSDFSSNVEYQAAIAQRYRKHKTMKLEYGKDFSTTDKRYVTDKGGSWSSFVRYALKYEHSEYGEDPVENYYDAKTGQPLIRLFWKYKKDSGTKSLPRLYYSSNWFVGSTHRQQIERYTNEQRAIAKSFSQKTIPVEAADLQVTQPVDAE